MYDNILLPVDLEEESSWRHALPTAIQFCKDYKARLHILTVAPDFHMSIVGNYFPSGYEHDLKGKMMTALKTFAGEHVPPEVSAGCIVAQGTVYEEVLKAAKEIKVDLIVVAAHRPALADYLLGPNAARIVRHATCSVMVVRG